MDFSRGVVKLSVVVSDVTISAVSDAVWLLANPKIVGEMKCVWNPPELYFNLSFNTI